MSSLKTVFFDLDYSAELSARGAIKKFWNKEAWAFPEAAQIFKYPYYVRNG